MFCTQCGTRINEDADYCYSCGAKIVKDDTGMESQPAEPANQKMHAESHSKRLKCPNCNSTDLVPVQHVETDASGGGYKAGRGCCGALLLGPFGLLCGLCGTKVKYSSKSRTDWVCKSCGNIFRNPKDVEREENEQNLTYSQTLLAICLVLYVAGNLFRDNGIRFLGIPATIYVTLGALGGVLGVLAMLGFATYIMINTMLENMENMGDEEGERYFSSRIKRVAGAAIAIFVVVFICGIVFAVAEIRFFWIPSWIYIVFSLLGTIVSVIALLFAGFLEADDKEKDRIIEKYAHVAPWLKNLK